MYVDVCNDPLLASHVVAIMHMYRKRRKFRGVINLVVFADTTIPRNLILGWVLIYYTVKPYQELYQFTQQFS